MKIRFVVPVFAALALSTVASAQSAKADPPKIGVIDFQAAIANTAEGKADAAALQTQFGARQQDLANISKQIDDLNTKLRTGQNTLSDDEKARIQTQVNQLTQSGQRKQQDLSDDENAAEQDMVQQIGSKMVPIVDKYGKDNGFNVILDRSSQSVVVYADEAADITQAVITLYDAANPAKGGAAPSSSATPHTTTPRSTTPRPSGGTGSSTTPK